MKTHKLNLIIIAAVFFPLAAVLFNQWYTKGGVPNQNQLIHISGKITKVWVTGKHKDTTRFQIDNSEKYFVYNSIGREVGKFLENAIVGAEISLSFSSGHSHTPIFEEIEYYTVYSVQFPGQWQRTYNEIKGEYESNAQLSLWAAIAFFLFPIYFFVKLSKNESKSENA
jgi:hypothetical protein